MNPVEVTPAELEAAHDATPAPYPDVVAQDDADDDLGDAKALLGIVPNSRGEAALYQRNLRQNHTFVGVGMCLRTVRLSWGLPALWPDANTAIDHGAPIHRTSDPVEVPWGASVVWENDRHGHIAFSLGGGLCSTTDYLESGFVGPALISRLGPWCGGRLVGWIETVNGYDVWPDQTKKPKPKPTPWGLAEREREVHRALKRAQDNDAPQRRVAGLKAWDDTLRTRLERHHMDRLPL